MRPTQPPAADQGQSAPGPLHLLRLREVEKLTGIKRSQIYLLQSRGDFPARIKLSVRASAYLAHEVEGWIAARVAASRPEPRK